MGCAKCFALKPCTLLMYFGEFSITIGCLHQVDIKRRSLTDIQRVLLPPFREGGAVFLQQDYFLRGPETSGSVKSKLK